MGFARFGDNRDIRSIFRGSQSNGQPDPATCSGHEQRLFVKRRNGFHELALSPAVAMRVKLSAEGAQEYSPRWSAAAIGKRR